ncbi:Raptor N-terminal CASPase like domain containing protein, putative [Leishmania donovani]|uniref:Raptor N-terminal CASPase like domain containing protein, putative n=1 Tax=Leishmania donovani TaxID=5661 RepID=A0A3S7WYY1_LEIDO|nr:Raptor N-terminal CASPase like domain containing protein, putative [Leishmania donovani]
MLNRRRNADQRHGPGAAVAPPPGAAAAAAGNAVTSSSGAISSASVSVSAAGPSSHAHEIHSSTALDEVINERVAAFAPCNLPSLVNDDTMDEASGGVGTLGDVTLVGGTTRYRVRITQAVLLMYLHIGSDPPGFPRVEPCAKMECWVDPMVAHVAKSAHRSGRGSGAGGGSDSIAETLERQYRSVLRDDVGVMRVVEASLEVSKSALAKSRRMARDGRILIHYNGHGMPRATDLGEVWVFDKERTHYVPLNITEMAELADTPAIYVFDCNSAGSLLQRWCRDRLHEKRPHDLFVCACSPGETLPLSPALPADLLTSCLTTPLRMALEWYIGFSFHAMLLPHVTADMIRNMPGDCNDRKSPRGELNWILNAVTDTIAWCTLPPAQFHYLFRQGTSIKGIFRNCILADRLLRESGCTPMTYPALSEEAHLHPMWELWEYTVDKCVSQLPRLLAATDEAPAAYEPSSFFDDQLTAFEVWVESGDMAEVPEQLPCVLLALTQVLYRVRAFTLLAKYLDSGRTAGKRAILCGILPYMSKLVTQAPEVFLIVTVLWMQVIRADPAEGCNEMQKCQCEKYFTSLLKLEESSTLIEYVEYGQMVNYARVESPQMPSPSFSPTTATAAPRQKRAEFQPRSQTWASTTSLDGAAEAGEQPLQPMQPMRSPLAEAPLPPPPPAQSDLAAAKLNSVANHLVNPGHTVYFLMKDVNLSRCKSMACYVLCQFLQRGERQCILSWNNRLLNAAFPCLSSTNAELRSWACLVLSRLFLGLRHAKKFASKECTSRLDLFTRLLQDRSPVVRSSCVTLLASIVGVRVDLLPHDQQVRRLHMEKSLLIKLREYIFDASMNVREELIFFCCEVLHAYRGVLSLAHRENISEYVLEVGQQGNRWVLEEAQVGVKSQLNAARPTVSSLFDDTVVFDTSFLTADDPLPPTREVEASQLSPAALQMVEGLLHDAALVLCMLYANCDGVLVNKELRYLSNGAPPQSQRFASEALRTMSRVASAESAEYWSEADRTRATWNTDIMRQLVLDMRDRKLEPHRRYTYTGSSPLLLQDPNGHLDTNSNGAASAEALLVSRRNTEAERHLVLRSAVRPDTVVCTTFRALEASMVVATKNQRISYISYDNYNSQQELHSFPVQLSGPLHDVHIINDLSEQSGLLLVDKRGVFTLMKGCWDPNSVPTEAAVFSACPPPPANRWLDLKSTYRSSAAVLFYGGPIATDGGTAIHMVSLAEEQVVQRLSVSGNPVLTSLETHTTQRALLAGFSDGVVRYYDDRQRQGQMGAVGMVSCRAPGAAVAAAVEAVVGAGPIATNTGFSIAAATRSAFFIFDPRKLSEPQLCVTHQDLYYGHGRVEGASLDIGGVGADAAAASLSSLPNTSTVPVPCPPLAPRIVRCSVGIHTGLVGLCFQNNTYAAFNTKGLILNERPLAVMADGVVEPALSQQLQQGRQSSGPPILPGSCVAHPLRPLMTFGGELMFLQL